MALKRIEKTKSNDEITSVTNNVEAPQAEQLTFIEDLKKIRPLTSKPSKRVTRTKGVLSIVSQKSYRIVFNTNISEELDLDGTVMVGILEDKIVLGKQLPNTSNAYLLSDIKDGDVVKKKAIYSKDVVLEITDRLNLDFSDRSTITFSCVTYQEEDGYKVAIISR